MQWRKPEVGGTRIVERFCLLPTTIGDTIYWLEWIKIVQRYTHCISIVSDMEVYGKNEYIEYYRYINERVLR